MHGVFRAEVGNNHLDRWRNITSHLPAAPWSAPGRGPGTAHPEYAHTQHNIITGLQARLLLSRTALCHYHRVESRESGGVRGALSTPMHWQRYATVRAAVPGAQQLTGGADPATRTRRPPRPRAQPVRAPHPSPPARVLSPPLIHYLRTADRFQARSLCPPLHDDRSNLMPFLCPASNTIRLRSASCGSRCSRTADAAAVITDTLDSIINKNCATTELLHRRTGGRS